MKALKHSPEWNPTPDKSEKHQIARNAKAARFPTPFGSMPDFQVHAYGLVPGVGRVDARVGKGPETLPINMGLISRASMVEDKARITYNSIKAETNSKTNIPHKVA